MIEPIRKTYYKPPKGYSQEESKAIINVFTQLLVASKGAIKCYTDEAGEQRFEFICESSDEEENYVRQLKEIVKTHPDLIYGLIMSVNPEGIVYWKMKFQFGDSVTPDKLVEETADKIKHLNMADLEFYSFIAILCLRYMSAKKPEDYRMYVKNLKVAMDAFIEEANNITDRTFATADKSGEMVH